MGGREKIQLQWENIHYSNEGKKEELSGVYMDLRESVGRILRLTQYSCAKMIGR